MVYSQLDIRKKLFPETTNQTQFEQILRKVSNKSFEEIVNEENTYEDLLKFKANSRLSIGVSNGIPFSLFIKNLISPYLDDFYDEIHKNLIIEDSLSFIKNITDQLFQKVWQLFYKSLIYEFNFKKSMGVLKGENSTQKFNYFERMLCSNDFFNSIQEKYKSLFNDFHIIASRYLENILNILIETETNWEELICSFNLKENDLIQNIEMGAGDSHQNGKSVALILFASSNKLVYKPRNLEIEIKFQDFLKKINNEFGSEFLNMNIVSKSNYGWTSFIEHKPCENEDEIQHFYQHIGYYLAIFYIMNANDMHYENIIAHKDTPVVVDLETIFSVEPKREHESINRSLRKTIETFKNSVLSISLLSTEIFNDLNHEKVELGGIDFNRNQTSPYKTAVISNFEKGDMKISLQNQIMEPKVNNPSFKNTLISSKSYSADIKSGFITLLNWFMKNKAELASYMKEEFSNKRIRFLNDNTMTYAKLLSISSNPEFSSDKNMKKLLFNRVGINKQSEVIPSYEYQDLLNMDIPYFTMITDQSIIFSSNDRVIKNEVEEIPLSKSLKKIENITPQTINTQLRMINLSFLNKMSAEENKTYTRFYQKELSVKNNHEKQYLNTAKDLGEMLINQMISVDDNGYWIGPGIDEINNDIWSPTIINSNLYNGNAGIAIFFAKLYKITNDEKYKISAYKALNPIFIFLKSPENEIKNHDKGLFTGITGFLYSIYEVSVLLADFQLNNFALNKIFELKEYIVSNKNFDYISGVSGQIQLFIKLYNSINCKEIKEKLMNLILELEKILENVFEFKNKYSGFAHGIAGYLATYALLYRVTHNSDFRDKADLLYKKLGRFFDTTEQDWNNTLEEEGISYGWCHGSPGILLSLSICKDSGIKINDEDINTALNNTKSKGFGNDLSLCHGDLGNFEIMFNFSRNMNEFNDKFTKQLNFNYFNFYQNNLTNVCNRQIRNLYAPGLMLGVSGLGLSLLNRISSEISTPLYFQ